MSGYPAHKRFACDRCRDQKLRCPRVDISGDEPCARCRRAGALCVTGGARPLGRPRTNSTPAATATSRPHMPRRDRDPVAVSSLTTSSRPTPSRQGRTTTPASATAAPGLSWPTMSTNDYASLLSVPNLSNTASPNLGDASLDMEHFFGMLVPDGDLAPYTPNSPLGGMQDGDANFATELDAIGSPNESMPDADSLRDTRRDTIQRGDGVSETPALASTEALISLSRLNESLSRQLGKINTYPWQAPPLIPGACSAKINSTSDNPVSEALQSTTSFVTILKSLSSTKTAQSPGSWSASDSGISVMGSVSSSGGINSGLGTTTGPALSTATYLLLLSCYLQLMQLYNTMFCRLVEFIGDMPEETISEFQPQSDLRVAGLPVMPNRLYIKVLVQIIDHQLESVERLMGLSAEYRISGRSAPRRGIFSEQDVAGLLQTVMGQADDSSGPGNTVTGKSLVVSLRDNMAKVQEVLRG